MRTIATGNQRLFLLKVDQTPVYAALSASSLSLSFELALAVWLACGAVLLMEVEVLLDRLEVDVLVGLACDVVVDKLVVMVV